MSPLPEGAAELHTTALAMHQNSESGEAPGKSQRVEERPTAGSHPQNGCGV